MKLSDHLVLTQYSNINDTTDKLNHTNDKISVAMVVWSDKRITQITILIMLMRVL